MRSRPGAIARGCAALLALLLLSACSGGSDDAATGADTTTSAQATGEPMDLTVLVYNIEYGGDASTDAVMRDIDADVVGVLESYNRLPEIARKTGYPYYNVGLQLLSKYPIHEPSGANGLYALIEVQPGYVVAFFNTHLDYVAYGPRLLNQGMPVEDVLASEDEVRAATMRILIPDMRELAEQGYPVVLTGDFNEPSSLDYGPDTVGTRPGIDEPIAWPVSEELFEIGMRDTFRDANPDPVANPGLTHDNPDFRRGGPGDRIDYVYAGGAAETLDSALVGQSGQPNVDIGFDTWTSDHKAVVSTLRVEPVAMPTTVSLDRRMLTEGDDVTVMYHAPGEAEVVVYATPEGGTEADAALSEQLTDQTGAVVWSTDGLAPGGYSVVMVDGSGEQLATNQFWVRSAEASVDITTDKDVYAVGEPVEVSWDNGPANRWDWIGLFRAGASDPENDDYLLWGYTGGHESGALPPSVSGSMTLDADAQGQPWPLPPGDYVVHYLLTDQYASAGETTFTVEP